MAMDFVNIALSYLPALVNASTHLVYARSTNLSTNTLSNENREWLLTKAYRDRRSPLHRRLRHRSCWRRTCRRGSAASKTSEYEVYKRLAMNFHVHLPSIHPFQASSESSAGYSRIFRPTTKKRVLSARASQLWVRIKIETKATQPSSENTTKNESRQPEPNQISIKVQTHRRTKEHQRHN